MPSIDLSNVRFRLLEPGEEDQLLSLHRRCFGGVMPLDEYLWKYRQLPDIPTVEVVAEIDGEDGSPELVGFYGQQGALFGHPDGGTYLCFQETDLMVDPRYRGLDFFKRLNSFTHDISKQRGSYFNYGFPNEQSAPIGFAKLGWTDVGRMWIWSGHIRLVSPRRPWLSRLLSLAGKLHGRVLVRQAAVELPDDPPAVTELPASEIRDRLDELPPDPGGRLRALRTVPWFRWRYLERPQVTYRFLIAEGQSKWQGVAVLRETTVEGVQELLVMDVLTEDEDVRATLVHALFKLAYDENIDVVRCWAMEHTPLADLLADVGCMPAKGPCHAAETFNPEVDAEVIDTRGNWATTQGDSDTA